MYLQKHKEMFSIVLKYQLDLQSAFFLETNDSTFKIDCFPEFKGLNKQEITLTSCLMKIL